MAPAIFVGYRIVSTAPITLPILPARAVIPGLILLIMSVFLNAMLPTVPHAQLLKSVLSVTPTLHLSPIAQEPAVLPTVESSSALTVMPQQTPAIPALIPTLSSVSSANPSAMLPTASPAFLANVTNAKLAATKPSIYSQAPIKLNALPATTLCAPHVKVIISVEPA